MNKLFINVSSPILRFRANHPSQNKSNISVDINSLHTSSIDEAKTVIKHGNVVGVSDPTGHIPCGHVFLTGMGERAPSEVFLTRVRNVQFVYLLEVQSSTYLCHFSLVSMHRREGWHRCKSRNLARHARRSISVPGWARLWSSCVRSRR